MTPGHPIGLGLRAYLGGDISASPDFPFQPVPQLLPLPGDEMDAGSVFHGLVLGFGALFGILKQILIYVLSFLYLLASPFLFLGNGLLNLALLPVRIILKFEVL